MIAIVASLAQRVVCVACGWRGARMWQRTRGGFGPCARCGSARLHRPDTLRLVRAGPGKERAA